MRIALYIAGGVLALFSIVLTGGGPVVNIDPASDSAQQVLRQSNTLAVVDPEVAAERLMIQPLMAPASIRYQELSAEVARQTQALSDSDIRQTEDGLVLTPSEGGRSVMVVREINGKAVIEEY